MHITYQHSPHLSSLALHYCGDAAPDGIKNQEVVAATSTFLAEWPYIGVSCYRTPSYCPVSDQSPQHVSSWRSMFSSLITCARTDSMVTTMGMQEFKMKAIWRRGRLDSPSYRSLCYKGSPGTPFLSVVDAYSDTIF